MSAGDCPQAEEEPVSSFLGALTLSNMPLGRTDSTKVFALDLVQNVALNGVYDKKSGLISAMEWLVIKTGVS